MSRTANRRLLSLDLFRGLTIAAMIVVNNQGSGNEGVRFASVVHAQWHGCSPADLIFPFFVFIIGVSAAFSLGRRVTTGGSWLPVYRHIFSRTLTIFLLGLVGWFAAGWLFQSLCPPAVTQKSIWSIFISPPTDTDVFFYSLANLRIPGVLQRLALVYLAVSLLVLHTRWQTQGLVAAALLLAHWGLMALPGFSWEAGQDLGSWVDRAIFGGAHLYLPTWDPEGLLGTLPAIATGLSGALTAHWLKTERPGLQKIGGLLLCGILGVVAGRIWGFWLPLNKSLWTSSYVLYTSGFALLFLGGLYGLTDVHKWRVHWTRPLEWLGSNPLLAYCLSQVGFMALYQLYLGTPGEHTSLLSTILTAFFGRNWDILGETSWRDPRWPSLFWGLACLTFWTLVVGPVYRKLAFLKGSVKLPDGQRPLTWKPVSGLSSASPGVYRGLTL